MRKLAIAIVAATILTVTPAVPAFAANTTCEAALTAATFKTTHKTLKTTTKGPTNKSSIYLASIYNKKNYLIYQVQIAEDGTKVSRGLAEDWKNSHAKQTFTNGTVKTSIKRNKVKKLPKHGTWEVVVDDPSINTTTSDNDQGKCSGTY